ncbi:hypothetical protein Adt_43542 [Abeliophyllum distichum]|uniref:DUF4408 domain-containing protein n=1 Tax=Abeliophyllum distichum TaxID=126358 RepID=A0ABD1P8B8_9LAMI
MDSLNIHGIKVEKANSIFRYGKLQKITTVFRFMELCVFLIILSRFSIQLPFAFKLSGEYFKGLCVTIIGPRFVFVIGNAIIIILFLKSGQLSAKDGEKNSKIDVYEEYMENCRKNQQNNSYENKKQLNKRKIHRSQSENMERMYSEEPHRELRRSMTEKCRKSVNNGKKPVAASRAKDEMSSEEFRHTVEAFIARQQRCLREEEEDFSAVVSYEK